MTLTRTVTEKDCSMTKHTNNDRCEAGDVGEVLDATTYYTDFEDDDFADLGEVLTDIPPKVLQVLKNSRTMYDWVVDQRRDPREIQLLSKAFPWLALNK